MLPKGARATCQSFSGRRPGVIHMLDALTSFLIEWLCFWRSEWRDDEAPEGTRPPRWLRATVVLLIVGGLVALVFWLP